MIERDLGIFKVRPRRLGMADYPSPATRALARDYYPFPEDILEAALAMLGLPEDRENVARAALSESQAEREDDRPHKFPRTILRRRFGSQFRISFMVVLKKIVQVPAIWLTRGLFVTIGLPVLWLLEGIRPVRFGIISTQQIGVLAGNIYVFLQNHSAELQSGKYVYIFPVWDASNQTLLEIGKRYLPIVENRWLTRIVFYCWPIAIKTRFLFRLPWTDMDFKAFSTGPTLSPSERPK